METCPGCGAEVLDIDVTCAACGEPLVPEEVRRRVGTTVLDQYVVTEVLGQGGMSVVYKGRHKLTEQEVALKILPPDMAAHSQVKSRFLEEARALAQLDHPNIVHLYNFGQHDGSLILAMQFVSGSTWERLIMSGGRLDWQTSVAMAVDVLRALELAHGRGIIHRDMKPSNVLVREDGSALVMDFGIAKMTKSSRLTATGQTMGTVRYMSPEQVRGVEVDARTDLYSLAVTLYESLCGETPFDGESHFEIMTAHLTAAPPTLASRGVTLPPGLEDVVMAGLAKDPAQRPQSARQMRAMLEELRSSSGVRPAAERSTVDEMPRPPAPDRAPAALADTAAAVVSVKRPRRIGPLFWLTVTGAALAVGALAVFLIIRPGSKSGSGSGSGSRSGGSGSGAGSGSGSGSGSASRSAWPAAHLLPDDTYAVDERFEADRVRVLSVAARSAREIRDQVVRAQRDFAAYLASHDLGRVQPQALNVLILPPERLCDRRLYETGVAPDDCKESDFWYRPADRTLYLADANRALTKLPFVIAVSMCLHNRVPDCDRSAVRFAEATIETE